MAEQRHPRLEQARGGKRWFTRTLLQWYGLHKRDLPWRRTRDPYHILVSEVMLQQTQVDRVVTHYERWLKRFPTVGALARAPQRDVLKQWSGMGYNRRALNLHRCAQTIERHYSGTVPSTTNDLLELPGIGRYTAGAIRAFAFRIPEAVVDTNIRRVEHRVFFGPEVPNDGLGDDEFWELAEMLYPKRAKKHHEWNHALMDFGALVCTKRKPACARCPLNARCAATQTIHERLQEHYEHGKKRQEEGMEENGKFVPNRLFRGRIIESLRQREEWSFDELARAVKIDYDPLDAPWLLDLLEQLEREEYIVIRRMKKGVMIALK